MTTASGEGVDASVRSAVLATYAVFIISGIAFASWASRIPQVRDRLHLDPAGLGLVLLGIAAGSVIALPLSGVIIGHFGSRWTVRTTGLLVAVALAVVSLGYLPGVVPVVIGLFLFGLGLGAWDVAMNVQGALAERRLGRAIMPRFHAGFSVGTVAGALIGAGMVALQVPVAAHLLGVCWWAWAYRSPCAGSCRTTLSNTLQTIMRSRIRAGPVGRRCTPGGNRGHC